MNKEIDKIKEDTAYVDRLVTEIQSMLPLKQRKKLSHFDLVVLFFHFKHLEFRTGMREQEIDLKYDFSELKESRQCKVYNLDDTRTFVRLCKIAEEKVMKER